MNSENIHQLATELRPVLTWLMRKMRKLSPANSILSQTERSILVHLEQREHLLSAELAVMEKITPQSMGQLINRLNSLDLIVKTASDVDKRKVYISISESGKDMIRQVRHERDEWLSQAIAEACTAEEQLLLQKALIPLKKLGDY